ncbi:MAG TPA: acyl-CoA dehydrogenase family protein [Pseudonocardia sp.]|nr:acyl-CoA dehydrogenase family protein [Pseudonocardia sp.]
MDFDLDGRQRDLLDRAEQIVTASGRERAYGVSALNGYDAGLDAALRAALPTEPGAIDLLDRVLLAERLSELGVATTVGLALAVGGATDTALPPGGVTVVGPSGLARFGQTAASAVVAGPGQIHLVDLTGARVEAMDSGFGYPYARIDVAGAVRLDTLDAARWHDAITLIRAAEVAGAAEAAVERTARHLQTREQFGRPLARLQALRHRFAETAVSAQATRWLAREAAYTRTPRAIAVAAHYAQQTAAALTAELVQLGGARSFAREFGMHVHTMRLEALRLELGAPDRLAAALNATSYPAGTGNGR